MSELLSRARNTLKDFVDFGCVDLDVGGDNWGNCEFCSAVGCENHEPDCCWENARKLVEEIDALAPAARPGSEQ